MTDTVIAKQWKSQSDILSPGYRIARNSAELEDINADNRTFNGDEEKQLPEGCIAICIYSGEMSPGQRFMIDDVDLDDGFLSIEAGIEEDTNNDGMVSAAVQRYEAITLVIKTDDVSSVDCRLFIRSPVIQDLNTITPDASPRSAQAPMAPRPRG